MTMFSALLRERQLDDLRALSAKTGQSVSELIRQAVDSLLANQDRVKRKREE